MNKKTALIAFLVVIVISVIGASAYLLKGNKEQGKEQISPLPEASEIDTSDWKVYRNEKYGFEVRYPSDWKVFEDYSRAVINIEFSGPALDKTLAIDSFLIQIYDRYNYARGYEPSNIHEWIEDFYPMKVTIEDITINGYPAVIARVPPEYSTPGSMAAILRNDFVFTFPVPSKENEAIFSTFKFIK